MYSSCVQDFKVPLGQDTQGKLVRPNEAQRGWQYHCPNPLCGKPLILAKGRIRAAHFKHKRGTWDASICNAETWRHNTAKSCIQNFVQSWISGKSKAPRIISGQQDERFLKLAKAFAKGLKPSEVLVEHQHSNRKPDVSLVCSNEEKRILALAIEVRATHAVNESKARDYLDEGISWIEVDAEEIIDDPSNWEDISDPEFHTPVSEPAIVEINSELPKIDARPLMSSASARIVQPANQLTEFLKALGIVAAGWAAKEMVDSFFRKK